MTSVTRVSASGHGFRTAGFAGLGGTVLLAVALLLPGAPPRTDEPSREILAFALAHRTALLLGSYLAALAALAMLWFMAGAWRLLDDTRREALLVAGVLAGVLGLGFVLAGIVTVSGFVLEAARLHDLALARLVTDTSDILLQVGLIGLSGFALAVCVVGRQRRLLPAWAVVLGLAGAIVVAATSLPALLVESGPWQLGGAIALAGTAPLAAWFLGFGLLMARHPTGGRNPNVLAASA